MQEIETIRQLICEQIEVSDCPTKDGTCLEHKRHFGIFRDILTAINQLEAKMNKQDELLTQIRHALNTLVYLKRYKEVNGSDDYYEEEKINAWRYAEIALSESNPKTAKI